MNNKFEDALKDLIQYYYVESEANEGVDWSELDRLMGKVENEFVMYKLTRKD